MKPGSASEKNGRASLSRHRSVWEMRSDGWIGLVDDLSRLAILPAEHPERERRLTHVRAIVEQLASESESSPRIVSLGGGAILREANRVAICRSGKRVWLTATPETLVERIRADRSTAARRPALSALNDYEEVVNVLAARRPLYLAVAQKIVDTENMTAEAISDEIAKWLKSAAE